VEELKKEGYTVKAACEALGIARSSYYRDKKKGKAEQGEVTEKAERKVKEKDAEIIEKIKEIKTLHPFWGYRRITAWLKYRENIVINEKRVRRIMKEENLMMEAKKYKAKRTPQRRKPRAERPHEIWGIDMTKFMIPDLGWVYLVIVIDWYTKKIVGWDIALRSRAEEWKRALHMAVNREFPQGVRGENLKLVSDNGSQPTSRSFMKDMVLLEIEQIFTSYNNPKGNAETERMMRTIKEEVIWLNEFTSLEEAKEVIGQWIEEDYNHFYPHSKLGYKSPLEFEKQYYELKGECAA